MHIYFFNNFVNFINKKKFAKFNQIIKDVCLKTVFHIVKL